MTNIENNLLKNKKGIIVGIANDRSLAVARGFVADICKQIK